MKRRLTLICSLMALWIAIFAIGKISFLSYNAGILADEGVGGVAANAADVVLHGLRMDLSTAAYLAAPVWLVCLISLWWRRMPVRTVLTPYHVVMALAVTLVIVGDIVMYPFWKFKLDNTVFSYMGDLQGATNSVSVTFIALRLCAVVAVAALVAWLLTLLTPRRLPQSGKRLAHTLGLILTGGLMFLCMRGSLRQSTMNAGFAYYSPSLFLNHAAVNPAFNFMASVGKNKKFDQQFNLLSDEECAETFEGLYPAPAMDITDTLLNTRRPNILIVLMESFGATFVKELGGLPDVAPQMSRLIGEGIFWDSMYANSFRTDRGTVSTFSGWVSYPTASLMRMGHSSTLPSLARSLGREGYACSYLYGGDIKIMGKQGYLISTGYKKLTSIKDFPLHDANYSKWGVNDSVSAHKTFELVRDMPKGQPWHMVLQTLSSHEPWQVPYKRLDDEVQNAFAFTDHCIGQLVDSLKTLPGWKDMLVILLPDHNTAYHITYDNPDFFHCPLIWLGGAVREPRRMPVLMNQSDLAATLLSQMGIRHDDFPWSRNVLSATYTYPFAYCTYPSGIMLRDSTGVTVYDTSVRKPTTQRPAASEERTKRAKAILQTSYKELGNIR